jgi:hypothetical protein
MAAPNLDDRRQRHVQGPADFGVGPALRQFGQHARSRYRTRSRYTFVDRPEKVLGLCFVKLDFYCSGKRMSGHTPVLTGDANMTSNSDKNFHSESSQFSLTDH